MAIQKQSASTTIGVSLGIGRINISLGVGRINISLGVGSIAYWLYSYAYDTTFLKCKMNLHIIK